MKRGIFSLLLVLVGQKVIIAQPKVMVGIVVDQMRYDYLTRYRDRLCDSGLKRIMGEGFTYTNAQ